MQYPICHCQISILSNFSILFHWWISSWFSNSSASNNLVVGMKWASDPYGCWMKQKRGAGITAEEQQRWGSTHQMSRKGHWTFWTQNFGLVVKWAEPNLENTRLYIFKPFPLQKIIKFLIIAIALCAKAKATLISRHFLDNSNTRKEDLTLPKSNAQKKINQFQNLHYNSDCYHHVQSK